MPAARWAIDAAPATAGAASIGTALSMRSAVQYFSSSLRTGPSEGVVEPAEGLVEPTGGANFVEGFGRIGSAAFAEGAETVGRPVGSSAAPAAADDAEDVGDCDATYRPAPEVVGAAEAVGSGGPVAADAGLAPSMSPHSPRARARTGTHLYLERNEVPFRLEVSRTGSDCKSPQ
nr:hypothetical protein StreXyl84_79100 [Streptomyces sp. Xyl84]